MSDEVLIEEISRVLPQFEKYFIRPFLLLGRDTMSSSQMKLLLWLIHKGEDSMSGLANRMEVSRPQLTSLVDGLVRMGFLQRDSDARDRRIVSVRPTQKALDFYEEIQKKALFCNRVRLSRLDDGEKESLYQALRCVRSLLEKTERENQRLSFR